MAEEKCRHPDKQRRFVDSCTERCERCGMLYAMVPTRSGCARRWIRPNDGGATIGKVLTEILLDLPRGAHR